MSNSDLHPERKIRFDGTINAGHLLLALGFFVSGFAVYTSIETRLTVLERTDVEIKQSVEREITHTRSIENEIKQALRDVVAKLDRLIERSSVGVPR